MERVIFHCDCNSFFASVELLQYPELRFVPTAVCGDPEKRHGVILAKNEAAKKYHVQTAESVYAALKKCPDLHLLPPHHERYRQFYHKINAIYAQFTDRVEPFGIDESWLDMTGSWSLFGTSPQEVAHILRRKIKAETGLTISVGVSFNKVFAKLGSDYKKPNAVTVIDKNNYQRIVWPLPIENLLLVGNVARKVLHTLNIYKIGQLAATDEAILQDALGKLGPQLHRYALGQDHAPVLREEEQQEIKSIGNGFTFTRNLVGLADIQAGVFSLSDEVASRLRKHDLYCNTVQIVIKDTALKIISRQKKLAKATHLAKDIGNAALALVQENWNLTQPIRMLTVTALSLTDDPDAKQISLFAQEDVGEEKQENLERTLDSIRKKYGKSSIAPAFVLQNDIGLKDIKND